MTTRPGERPGEPIGARRRGLGGMGLRSGRAGTRAAWRHNDVKNLFHRTLLLSGALVSRRAVSPTVMHSIARALSSAKGLREVFSRFVHRAEFRLARGPRQNAAGLPPSVAVTGCYGLASSPATLRAMRTASRRSTRPVEAPPVTTLSQSTSARDAVTMPPESRNALIMSVTV